MTGWMDGKKHANNLKNNIKIILIELRSNYLVDLNSGCLSGECHEKLISVINSEYTLQFWIRSSKLE